MKLTLGILIPVILLTVGASADVLRVPSEYGNIADAIDAAGDGDTVLIAPGLYLENVVISGKSIVLASGFLFDSSLVAIPETVINGSNPLESDRGSVVTISGEQSSGSKIVGLTLTGGIGTYLGDRYAGGGVLIDGCPEADISHNLISLNSATYGGGIAVYGSGADIRNNVIAYDFSTYGGGIDLDESSVSITKNMIAYNDASIAGGAVNISDSQNSLLQDNIIYENNAGSIGGIRCGAPGAQIWYNSFWGNAGGGCVECNPAVGDTSCCRNFNGVPCDTFMNIFRDPIIAYIGGYTIAVECSSALLDAGSEPNQNCPMGGARTDIGPQELEYLIGDIYPDQSIDITDIVWLIDYVYGSASAPCPDWRGDWNSDRKVNLIDISQMVNYIFKGGHSQVCDISNR